MRELAAVQGLVDAGLDLAGEEVGRRGDRVVAGVAGEQLRFQGLIRVVGVVDDADAGLGFEILYRVLADVVGPVVEVEHPVASRVLSVADRVAAGAQSEHGGQEHASDAHGKCASLSRSTTSP